MEGGLTSEGHTVNYVNGGSGLSVMRCVCVKGGACDDSVSMVLHGSLHGVCECVCV